MAATLPTIVYVGDVQISITTTVLPFGYPVIFHDDSFLIYHDTSNVSFHGYQYPDVSNTPRVPRTVYVGEVE